MIQTLRSSTPALTFSPLPLSQPLLLIGHGTRSAEGRQEFLDFAETYQACDRSRLVMPCFLELTQPNIYEGVAQCVAQGFTQLTAVPLLLLAARHNKFDVTHELDQTRAKIPDVKFQYGRHLGITPAILDLWRERLKTLDRPEHNPQGIPRSETVLLFIGRGSSDPDANGDAVKLARLLWEGSGYRTVETCFIGITHPRLEEGFLRSQFFSPKRVIVLPYFLFTGKLMQKIERMSAEFAAAHPEIWVNCLPEMGTQPELLKLLRDREIEAQLGQVAMNCEMCKFRLVGGADIEHHHYEHGHHHSGNHHHHGAMADPYADLGSYHERIWNTP
ncbi:MAG: sirohydrochlorin chelatase [Cyanobacteria bacterium P01_H01_bin.15]